jgi:hypothetical protein
VVESATAGGPRVPGGLRGFIPRRDIDPAVGEGNAAARTLARRIHSTSATRCGCPSHGAELFSLAGHRCQVSRNLHIFRLHLSARA